LTRNCRSLTCQTLSRRGFRFTAMILMYIVRATEGAARTRADSVPQLQTDSRAMAILDILTFPDPILRRKAAPVTDFNDELKKLAADMGETMYAASGIGLAANQVGVLQQIIVVDVSTDENNRQFTTFVNPVLSDGEGSEVDEEGCLSVIEYTSTVTRFKKVKLSAQNLDGKKIELIAEDRFARVLQHEVDHLHGKLFIDRISALKR